MELPELIAILRRRWWLVALVPIVTAAALVWQARTRPYQVTVRATILIPGDTEIPGSSERPELMVLDDLPSLVASRVFAEGVHAAMPGTDLTVEDVQSSMQGQRYSRVLTVAVTRDRASEATTIANAVAQSLPDLVNRYLIPVGGAAATVRIIDVPGEPTRARPNQTLKSAVLILAALGAGAGLAVVADLADPRLHSPDQIARAFDAPILADLRRTRRRRSRLFRKEVSVESDGQESPLFNEFQTLAVRLEAEQTPGADVASMSDQRRTLSLVVTSHAGAPADIARGLARAFTTGGRTSCLVAMTARHDARQNHRDRSTAAGDQLIELVNAETPGLKLVRPGDDASTAFSELMSDQVRRLDTRIGGECERIVWAGLPITSAATLAVAAAVDGVLIVATPGLVTRDAARRARDAIASVRGHLLGVILGDD